MFGEGFKYVGRLLVEKGFKLIDCDDRYRYNLSFLIKSFGVVHSMETFKKCSELFQCKVLGKDEPLEVGPNVGQGLDKVIGVVSFDHSLDFWLDVNFNEFTYVKSNMLIESGSFLNSGFLVGELVDLSELNKEYVLSYL